VHSPEGVAPKGVSGRVFLNLRRMQEYGNLPSPYGNNYLLISSIPFRFVENKYFHRNMGTYKIGELHQHNTLGFFCWGDPSKYT